jgi:iron complex outermembrane recepter protein
MMRPLSHAILLVLFAPMFAHAAEPEVLDEVQVTSSKIPLKLRDGTASVSVVDADDLRARGATDLRSALALVSGVDIAPGGDGGAASSVPAMRGLREFDAILLLVDGVPVGGAFVPALSTLSLAGVERIEVLKGAAPVSYGATSFVGVINVIHYAAGEGPREFSAGAGNRNGARFALYTPISSEGALRQSLVLDIERQDLIADRADWGRSHLLYRTAADIAGGDFTADLEIAKLRQSPGSPVVREGRVLTSRVSHDANHNPADARLDETRTQLSLGYSRETGLGRWDTRLAATHAKAEIVRGFLRGGFATNGVTINADGYRQHRDTDDLYFDTHLTTEFSDKTTLVWGADHLYGDGHQHSQNFEYAVRGDGANPPSSRSRTIDESTWLGDLRGFTGLYADLLLKPTEAWRVEAGVRYNDTRETRRTYQVPVTGPTTRETRNESRWTGALGSSYRLWGTGEDYLTVFGGYRRTFKPAVVDFGPEAEAEILKPETATTWELGLRGGMLDGQLDWELSTFRMDFENLVVTQDIGGSPGLINAGAERFDGAEFELDWRPMQNVEVTGTYAWHDARFGDYVQLFGSTPTQLRDKRLEMSPQHLASIGVTYAPVDGLHAYVTGAYAGGRYLNKRNTAPVAGYTTFDAGVGYRFKSWDLSLDATNLTDRRDAVAESELGDAQYYLLPARTGWLNLRHTL